MQNNPVKNRIFRSGIVLLAIVLLCATCVLPLAAKEGRTTVRVACGHSDFLYMDESGTAVGYYAEYLKKLAERNDWDLVYVKTTREDAPAKMQNGELDLFFPVSADEIDPAFVSLSELPVGYAAPGLFAMESSGFGYEEYTAFDGKRIVLQTDSPYEEALNAFAWKQHFTYRPVYVDTAEDVTRALRDGRAELALMCASDRLPGGVLAAVLEAKPVYLAVPSDRKDLLETLNRGMQSLVKSQPTLISDVLQKTLTGENTGAAAMTEQERAFVASGTPVKVGFYKQTEPLAFVRSDGSFDGVYVEMMHYLAEASGLHIQLVALDRDRNWKDALASGEVDFYIGASSMIAGTNDQLKLTDALFEYVNILVTKNDCAFGSLDAPVIALTNGRAYWTDYLRTNLNANIQIRFYETSKECMLAVANGEADASLLNNHEFNYHSKNKRLSSLIQWAQYRFVADVGLCAYADVDPLLFSTVDKAIRSLDSDRIGAIIEEFQGMAYDSYSFADTLYNARVPLIVAGILVIGAVSVVLVALYFRRRAAAARERAREREKHQLQILAALSRNYIAIYYTDLDRDSCELLQVSETVSARTPEWNTHSASMNEYIDTNVLPEYHDLLRPYCDPKQVIERFRTEKDFVLRYRAPSPDGKRNFFEMHFVDVSRDETEHRMVFGVRCIDELLQEEQAQQKLMTDALDGANRANAAKSDFLSRMSHDIRTPMNAIIGMTAIAEAHANSPERVAESLRKISASGHHLLTLLNEVLDMSKIEAGKMNLAREELNLKELIEGLLNMMQPEIRAHRHTLSLQMEELTHPDVIGDSLRLRRAFLNLLGNAVKYTPDGGHITLIVREKPINTPSVGCFEFVFADNGIGMSEEVRAHIFDPFVRAEEIAGSVQGTGLGLPITRNIVQMMNGSIHVDSEPGKGSVFTVTVFLDLRRKRAESDPSAGEENGLELLSSGSYAGKRILLVEDNELNREIAREILEMAQLSVEEAFDGKEALERFSRSEIGYYDLILMDIRMPVMNGHEAAIAIRALPRADALQVPIVAMSANAFVEDMQASENAGMNEHIPKPIDIRRLNEILKRYLA